MWLYVISYRFWCDWSMYIPIFWSPSMNNFFRIIYIYIYISNSIIVCRLQKMKTRFYINIPAILSINRRSVWITVETIFSFVHIHPSNIMENRALLSSRNIVNECFLMKYNTSYIAEGLICKLLTLFMKDFSLFWFLWQHWINQLRTTFHIAQSKY